jgi:apolipoprotein D and lipocalin family protein
MAKQRKTKFCGRGECSHAKSVILWAFYGGYNVVAIDKEYKYALVAGGSLNYLWILSREKSIQKSPQTT